MVIFLLSILLAASAHPLQDGISDIKNSSEVLRSEWYEGAEEVSTETAPIDNDYDVLVYIRNCNNLTAGYILSNFSTAPQVEQVKNTIGDSMNLFQKDPKEIVNRQVIDIEIVPVGEYMKRRLLVPYPNINESMMKQIISKLWRNLPAIRKEQAAIHASE